MLKKLIFSALALLATQAFALDVVRYDSEGLKKAQESGKPVALYFHATWCSTCRAIEREFLSMKGSPDLKGVTLYIADYDLEKPLRKTLNVRSQSTVLVYKGHKQTALISGNTEAGALKTAL